jgi:crotonobetainyl-CoA:carnitine CoA-transferase CaiB-like acyl-CoA transferase
MQWARGRDDKPEQVPFPVNDFATGMLGALGVVLALLRRELTGRGSHVRASLARSATFLQLESFEKDMAKPRLRTTSVKCTDGWISVVLGHAPDSSLDPVLAAGASRRRCDEAIAEFSARGLSAFIERRPKDLVRDPDWLIQCCLMVRWEHPALGELIQATPAVTASAFQSSRRFPAPILGGNTEEILRDAGCSPAQVAGLLSSGIAIKDRSLFAS